MNNSIYIKCERPVEVTMFFENGVPVYCGERINYNMESLETINRKVNRNMKQLQYIDKQARKKGEILGRYIEEPISNGKAYYQIVKVNRRTVQIKLIENIGYDYMVPYWGRGTTIERNYAEENIIRRDNLENYF